jgi:jagged-1
LRLNYYSVHVSQVLTGSLIKVFFSPFQILAAGYFELQILEISNTNSHLLTGYCCGLPMERRSTQTTGCPPCETSFRLCLKEYQQGTAQPGELSGLVGCAFGNASTLVLGSSSFVLSEPEVGALVLPFTFRWTVSTDFYCPTTV